MRVDQDLEPVGRRELLADGNAWMHIVEAASLNQSQPRDFSEFYGKISICYSFFRVDLGLWRNQAEY
jgi:hypothetical protein